MQSDVITNEVVSLSPVHGEVYSIQHYVIKFVSSMVFSRYSTNKTDHYDITDISLKVALNTINLNLTFNISDFWDRRIFIFFA